MVVFGGLSLVAAVLVYRWTAPSEDLVASTTASVGDVEDTVATVGEVVPAEEFTARASYPATVSAVLVKLGQHVKPGDLLVTMKDPFAASRIAAATANLETTEVGSENVHHNGSQEDWINLTSDLDHARMEEDAARGSLGTLEKLQATGDASAAEVGAAKGRVHAAEGAMRSVQERMSHRYSSTDQASWDARVEQARAALSAERANLSNINIRSPIAGVVYLIPIAPYDFVGSGAPLVNVANLNAMKINARFDEPDIGKLHDGQSVTIAWEGRPDHLWHGHIQHAPIAVIVQGERRVGDCAISIDDAREDLPAHSNVTVTVLLQRRLHVVTVPHEALQHDPAGFFVYRVLNGRLLRTPVEIGLFSVAKVEIRRGLVAGDRIALHRMDERPMSNALRVRLAE